MYLQNANGPSAEAMLSFSDLTITLILPILTCVLFLIFSRLFSSPSFRYLKEHQALEFTWTLLPSLSLLLLAVPSLSLLYLLDEVGHPVCTYKIQGHQWYWHYEFSDLSHSSFESYITPGPLTHLIADTSLVVRSSSVLRFLVTAADVLHS